MMATDLVFDPERSIETLEAVARRILEKWALLPEEVRQQFNTRRFTFCATLLSLKDYQRSRPITELLTWIEATGALSAVAGDLLQAGKAQPKRSGFARIDNARITQLQTVLEAPAPVDNASQTPTKIAIEYQIRLICPTKVETGLQTPLTVQLTRQPPTPKEHVGSVVIEFENISEPQPIEVALIAPGFTEKTGSLKRTIYVYSSTDSLPAVFPLEADTALGEQQLTVAFQHAISSIIYPVEITAVSKGLTPQRGFESLGLPHKGPRDVDYFTKINFPGQILPKSLHPLIVQLTLQVPKETAALEKVSLAFADVRKPEFIEVVVTAPDFQEETEQWQRVFAVYSHSDSQPAVFLLRAGATVGRYPITVDFYHKQRLVGSAKLATTVATAMPTPGLQVAQTVGVQMEEFPANPPAPADLELRIVLNDQTNELSFILHSPKAELGYQRRPVGVTKLNANPRQFMVQTFKKLNVLAARTVDNLSATDASVNIEELEIMGQGLFEDLFPRELQEEYWHIKQLREQGKIHSLQIVSDEPWIPWEMVKPFKFVQKSGQTLEDGYLAETFQLCRWLTGRGPAHEVNIATARLVAPDLDLDYVQKEREYFEKLGERGINVGAPLRNRGEVLEMTGKGALKLLHLAAHGTFKPDNVNESSITLESNAELRPSDLAGARSLSLRRERPIVFFNACHSARIDFALTGLGGWADKMVKDIGVSVFIGSLWEVNDLLAADFAIHFYDKLIAGETFGAAFQSARLAIRDRQPANPTWLAYTLYAEPNGKAIWGIK